ncbi:hypothetical protein Vretifemale_874, partial [Volvox reticuliferus]
ENDLRERLIGLQLLNNNGHFLNRQYILATSGRRTSAAGSAKPALTTARIQLIPAFLAILAARIFGPATSKPRYTVTRWFLDSLTAPTNSSCLLWRKARMVSTRSLLFMQCLMMLVLLRMLPFRLPAIVHT